MKKFFVYSGLMIALISPISFVAYIAVVSDMPIRYASVLTVVVFYWVAWAITKSGEKAE